MGAENRIGRYRVVRFLHKSGHEAFGVLYASLYSGHSSEQMGLGVCYTIMIKGEPSSKCQDHGRLKSHQKRQLPPSALVLVNI